MEYEISCGKMEICCPFTGKHDKKCGTSKKFVVSRKMIWGWSSFMEIKPDPHGNKGEQKNNIYIYTAHTYIYNYTYTPYISIHIHTYPYIPTYNCIHIEEGTTVYEFVHRGWGLCDTKKMLRMRTRNLSIYLSIYPSYPILSVSYLSIYLPIYLSIYLYQTSKVF